MNNLTKKQIKTAIKVFLSTPKPDTSNPDDIKRYELEVRQNLIVEGLDPDEVAQYFAKKFNLNIEGSHPDK